MAQELDENKITELARRQEQRADLLTVYIDTWATLVWRGHIRIVLGEELYGRDIYRYAILMDLGNAEALARDILKRVQRQKERESEADNKKQNDSPNSSDITSVASDHP